MCARSAKVTVFAMWFLSGVSFLPPGSLAQSVWPEALSLLGEDPEPQTLTLDSGCPAGARQWRAHVAPATALAEWLELSSTGAASAGGEIDIDVAAATTGLEARIYSATVTFTSTTDCDGNLLDSPLQLGSAVIVLDLQSQTRPYRVEPAEVTLFLDPQGPARELAVSLVSACEDGPGRSWVATLDPPADWLTVTPQQGDGLTGTATLTLRAEPDGLDPAGDPEVTVLMVTSTDCDGEDPEDPRPGEVLIHVNVGDFEAGDADGDGVTDDQDNCPDFGNARQFDADLDGVGDLCDDCPLDASKHVEGDCGCGDVDVDSDADGVADCIDDCPYDAAKSRAGQCGCGLPDLDADGDGDADCLDDCPTDPAKSAPGICGCGYSEEDLDRDGVFDCLDDCLFTAPDADVDEDGCGPSERDSDFDGLPDLFDDCPHTPVGQPVDFLGCAVFELDSDGDGINNAIDQCPLTPPGRAVDFAGCALPEVPIPDETADDADRCSGSRGRPGTPGDDNTCNDDDASDAVRDAVVEGDDSSANDADEISAAAPACGAMGPALLAGLLLLACSHPSRARLSRARR